MLKEGHIVRSPRKKGECSVIKSGRLGPGAGLPESRAQPLCRQLWNL